MQLFNRLLTLVSGLIFLVPFSYAATITGNIKGPDGGPFMGAFVIAENAQNRMTVSVLADKDGQYRIDNVPAGKYSFRVRAIGYQSDPQTDVNLSDKQSVSFDFGLRKGTVRWSDLTLYQGMQLLPKTTGQDALFQNCFTCHGFQTHMASVARDEDGWRDRVNYMRQNMDLERLTDDQADAVVKYLTSTFGPDSTKPKSPADMPEYKNLVRSFSDRAMNIVYVEYDVSGSNGLPWSAVPDKDGNLWIPYYGRGNEVARLNPKTAEVTHFPLPPEASAGIHSAIPAPDGTVWFTEFFLNKIAHLDPKTKEITEYQDEGTVPDERPSKHTIRMDKQGRLWMSGSPLSRFDVETKKFTHYPEVPSSYGLIMDAQGNMWFAVYTKDGAIGKVDAKTGKLSVWPTNSGSAMRLQVDSDGIVWFSGRRQRDTIGRFDPKTETFKTFALPGPSPSPYPLNIDRDHYIWYGSTNQDTIGRLDPKTGQVTEYPFPHTEGLMREFFTDSQGRMWYATPTSNRVGYFYLAESSQGAKK
jgi:virginiamycin B lyase